MNQHHCAIIVINTMKNRKIRYEDKIMRRKFFFFLPSNKTRELTKTKQKILKMKSNGK